MKNLYLYILIAEWILNEFIKNIYLYPVTFKYIEYFSILKVILVNFAYFINGTIYFKQHLLSLIYLL